MTNLTAKGITVSGGAKLISTVGGAPDVISQDQVDLQIWYDFSDSSTVNLTGGDIISVDGKGYASVHDANTTGGTTRPAYLTASRNSLNTGSFDGTTDYLTINPFTNFNPSGVGISGYTAFYVAKFDTTSNQRLTETDATGTSELGFGINSNGRYEYHVGGGTLVGDYADTNWHVHCFRFDGTQPDGSEVTALIDNYSQSLYESSAVGDSALTDTGVVYIGSSATPNLFFDGEVGEMVVFTRALSDSDIATVHTYLQDKWNISTKVAWAPSTDITPVAWIDASDSSNYTTSGSTLTAVTDKAGTYTMSVGGTPTIISNALNGKSVFDFDGNGEYLQSTSYLTQVSSGNHWAIGVFRFEVTDSTQDSLWSYETNQSPKRDYAISSGASNNTWPGELDMDGLSSNRISNTIGNLQVWNSKSLTQNTYHVVACFFNKTGNQIGVRVDGSNAFTPVNDYTNSISTNQELRLMRNRASQELDGKLAEFFAVADVPGTGGTDISELEKAEGYLAHKWGLTSGLPASHPYKNSAP